MTETQETIQIVAPSSIRHYAWVFGVEAQGSKRIGRTKAGKPIALDASPRTRPWRQGLSEAMLAACDVPLVGAVAARLVIHVERPQAHYRTGKRAGELKPNVPLFAPKGKDADKVQRAVGDAGNCIWWRDDSQIAHWHVLRLYTEGKARVEVWAWELDGGAR